LISYNTLEFESLHQLKQIQEQFLKPTIISH
jgi:hypothetical protein